MAHLDIDTVLGWRGRTVRDPDGDKIGSFGDVFLDRETDRPAWVGVRTGLFGRHESYVPLDGVTEDEDGDLRVPFAAGVVKEAPRIDPDVALTADEEQTLYAHYGRDYERPVDEGAEMTRSEEEVSVHEGPMKPAERVRLRKVLVTDERTVTVPVRREVVQLETAPPPPGRIERVEDVDESSSGPSAPR